MAADWTRATPQDGGVIANVYDGDADSTVLSLLGTTEIVGKIMVDSDEQTMDNVETFDNSAEVPALDDNDVTNRYEGLALIDWQGAILRPYYEATTNAAKRPPVGGVSFVLNDATQGYDNTAL